VSEVAVEHVVFFPAPDGNPAFRRLPSLDDAVRFVEFLRNSEDVTEVSVHALTAVPLAVRTVYRVEVAADAPVVEAESVESVESVVEAADAPVAEAVVEAESVVDAAEPVAEAVAEVPAVETVEETVAEPVAEVPAQGEALAEEDAVAAGNGTGDVRSLGFFAG
jgi:hypothetical protein